MIERITLKNIPIDLCVPKTACARKLGLLNHVNLGENTGVLYQGKRIFHTFGMHFPIFAICLDQNKSLILDCQVIAPGYVFVAPKETKYVIETHFSHQKSIQSDLESQVNLKKKKQIKIFSKKASKIFHIASKRLFLSALFLILLIFIFPFAFAEETISLNLGRSRVLDLGRAPQTIQVSDPEVIDVQRVGVSNSIRITPKQGGDSSIAILYSEGEEVTWNVHVGKEGSNQNARDAASSGGSSFEQENDANAIALDAISKPLTGISGIQISKKIGKIVVLGKITKLDDFRKLSRVVASHPTLFFPAFEFSHDLETPILNSINTDLHTFGEKNLSVSIRNGLFTVTGVPSTPAGKTRAWNFLNALVPHVVDASAFSSGESTVIQVNLDFLEVGKSQGTRVGFNPSGLSEMAANLNFASAPLSQGIVQPALQIAPMSFFFKALEDKNFVRDIAKPVVITRSGEKASFLAGGEVPIVASMANNGNSSSSVVFKPFGILFHVTPQSQVDGSIWLKLDLEVSQVSEALSYQNIPGFTTRKVNTNIILKEGNTAVLSGLVQNKDLKQVEKIPLLGSLPILGELLKSRRFQNQDTELWVAVTAVRWNPEEQNQNLHSYSNQMLEEKFNEAKKFTHGSLMD